MPYTGTKNMLKPLALTLLVATFLASGFTLVPAETMQVSNSLSRTETFTSENMTVIPMQDEELTTTQTNTRVKTDREDAPQT